MAMASNMLSNVSSYCIQDTLRFANKPMMAMAINKQQTMAMAINMLSKKKSSQTDWLEVSKYTL